MDMTRGEGNFPVFNDGGVDTSTTSKTEENEIPDEPIEDPSSKGLSFVSNGDGTCSLDALGECSDTFIIVPTMSPEGDIVTEIADGAFKNSNKIRGIELPSTLKKIGGYAFYGSGVNQ